MFSINPPARLLVGSGPTNPEPRVLRALSAPPLMPDDPAFGALLEDLTRLLREVFRTRTGNVLAAPGASRAGIEAVLGSLVEPGDRVVVGVFGHFGELLCALAARHGAAVERVEAEWGRVVDPGQMIASIERVRPKLVAIVHADTSTGMLQPLEAIGRACHAAGSLFVVDAVLSLGGCEVSTDDWSLDGVVGGMQKCLGGPPGMAPLALSDRAQPALAGRRRPPHSTYLDVARLAAGWRNRDAPMSTSMLYGLREALRMIVDEEQLQPRWARHLRASQALVAGLTAMGLELFGDRAHAVPMITLVRVPDGVSEPGVRGQLLEQHGVEIMAAFGPLRGQVWRIGTMGTNARLESVLLVLAALEAVLAAHGLHVPRGAAVDAASAAYAETGGRAQSTMRR